MAELRISPFPKELRQKLKILAAVKGISLRELVTACLRELVKELKP